MTADAWTGRDALRRQYAGPTGLATRVGLYRYLVDDQLDGTSWPDWVLGRVAWRGTELAVDVGCGPGTYDAALAGRARAVVGLDLSEGMLARPSPAAGGTRGVAPVVPPVVALGVADAQALPLRDGSADVVLAAHMLYHVPDVGRALAEARRVLRPGGTALLVANGAGDKREMRELWAEAAAAVLDPSAAGWTWVDRFNIDDGLAAVADVFDHVERHALPGELRFPSPEPVLAWVESLRPGTGAAFGLDGWDRVTAELRARLTAHIARHGHFTTHKSSGVLVAH